MKGVFFIRFAKPGRLKDTMSDWERQQNLRKTEKQRGGSMPVERNILIVLNR